MNESPVQSQDCPSLAHEQATVRHRILFAVALAFLVLLALVLHALEREEEGRLAWDLIGGLFFVLWLSVFLESLIGYFRRGEYSWQASGKLLLLWLVPPYRMILSTHPNGPCLWVPFLGWQVPDRALFARLERAFSVPMLFMALLILPILAIETFGSKYIHFYPELQLFLDFGTSLIWLAFSLEFIFLSSLAESKWAFLLKNWLNLVIILLPLFAFLRSLRLVRLLRLGRTARLLRVYQLRGLIMRAWRGIVALELMERILHRDPKTRLAHLKAKLQSQERDLAILRQRIQQLETRIAREAEQRAGPD